MATDFAYTAMMIVIGLVAASLAACMLIAMGVLVVKTVRWARYELRQPYTPPVDYGSEDYS